MTYDEMNERELLAAVAANVAALTRELRDSSRRIAAATLLAQCQDHYGESLLRRGRAALSAAPPLTIRPVVFPCVMRRRPRRPMTAMLRALKGGRGGRASPLRILGMGERGDGHPHHRRGRPRPGGRRAAA